jgi:hypothetical protein
MTGTPRWRRPMANGCVFWGERTAQRVGALQSPPRKGSSAKMLSIEVPSFALAKDIAATRSDLNLNTDYRR